MTAGQTKKSSPTIQIHHSNLDNLTFFKNHKNFLSSPSKIPTIFAFKEKWHLIFWVSLSHPPFTEKKYEKETLEIWYEFKKKRKFLVEAIIIIFRHCFLRNFYDSMQKKLQKNLDDFREILNVLPITLWPSERSE